MENVASSPPASISARRGVFPTNCDSVTVVFSWVASVILDCDAGKALIYHLWEWCGIHERLPHLNGSAGYIAALRHQLQ